MGNKELVIIETDSDFEMDIIKFLNECDYSKSEARRLIKQGAVKLWVQREGKWNRFIIREGEVCRIIV